MLLCSGRQVCHRALGQELIDRIRSSVLSLLTTDDVVIATTFVWDYTDSHVLLLTNYHTWDDSEFKYCFPPSNVVRKKRRKNSPDNDGTDPVHLKLRNDIFETYFVVTSEIFHSWERAQDFAVLKLPKTGFTMPRIPVSLGVSITLKIHAFGYVGHTSEFNVSDGEVSGFVPQGFTMNLLSAGVFSGAAIIADGQGRAIGYMGGNLDTSKDKNSQHQSYGFRFDCVIQRTNRQLTPTNSPENKGSSA
jgi:hypothetical protein